MNQGPKVTVIGSANMDLVIRTDRQPQLGETIIGNSFHQFLGGKGANQSVAASRLGAEVTFIGCIGSDSNGGRILDNLKEENINTDYIIQTDEVETGIAQITVTELDNMIIFIPGANERIAPEHIDSFR